MVGVSSAAHPFIQTRDQRMLAVMKVSGMPSRLIMCAPELMPWAANVYGRCAGNGAVGQCVVAHLVRGNQVFSPHGCLRRLSLCPTPPRRHIRSCRSTSRVYDFSGQFWFRHQSRGSSIRLCASAAQRNDLALHIGEITKSGPLIIYFLSGEQTNRRAQVRKPD